MKKIVLASGSPRRSELLEQINATVKETRDSGQMEKFKEEAVAQAPEEE